MQQEHKQTKSAQRIVWRLQNRYANRMDIVYLLIKNELYDTRSVHRRTFFSEWLDKHEEYSGFTRSVLEGEAPKQNEVPTTAKDEKEKRLEQLKKMIETQGWEKTFSNMEETASQLGIAVITLYRYMKDVSKDETA